MNYLTDLPDELIFNIYYKVLVSIINSNEFHQKNFEIKTRKMSLKQRNHLKNYYSNYI